MKKIYYLSTCSTCSRIIAELGLKEKGFVFQDIKNEPLSAAQLDEMRGITGSYESLFSRVALKYRALGLDKKELLEDDYKKYILSEYTFLKRPVIFAGKEIFVGNSKKNIEAAASAIDKLR